MLNPKMQDAINKQINAELYSSYLYLSMAACFEARNLKGMANWMRIQVSEELQHAVKFSEFLIERGGRVLLAAIDGPKTDWESPLEAFEDAYKHECTISELINSLVDLAVAERDHASNAFLQWFVTEQVEEESAALEVAEKLKLAGNHPGALFMLDKELGQRVLVPAADPSGQ